MAVQASATDTIDNYIVIARYSATLDQVTYAISTPSNSPLFRANGSFGVINGFNLLATQAAEAGDTELADTYRSLAAQANATTASLESNIRAQLAQVQPPPPSEPIPPAAQDQPNPNTLSGPANDDTSYDKKSAATLAAQTSTPEANTSNSQEIVNNSYAGANPTSVAAAQTTSSGVIKRNVVDDPKPGTRLKNPLGDFSSYTYQLSLYMITPDAYSAYVNGGRVNPNQYVVNNQNGSSTTGGAYLILQSGGVNTQSNKRPPGMKYDYYIDNLIIKSVTNTKATMTESNITEVRFTVIEPYGFSLINDLKRAHESLKELCKIKNYNKTVDPLRQFFILGIRFQGYDKNGQLANSSNYFSNDTANSSDGSGVYERFYEVVIDKFTFKLGGGATTYNISAKVVPDFIGKYTQRSSIKNNITVLADTVENALGPNTTSSDIVSLLGTLNQNVKKLEGTSREIADEFDIRWIGDSDIIKNSLLRSPANTDKSQAAPSTATKQSEVNEVVSQTATYDSTKKSINIKGGTTILQAISKIIRLSQYLESALITVYKSTLEPSVKTNTPEQVPPNPNPPTLKWFNVGTEIEVLGFDTKIQDYAYKITYVIQPYETPAAYAGYGKQTGYYGAHKRYEYWFTGKNTEILNFEMQYDNAFFNVNYGGDQTPGTTAGQVPIVSGQYSGQDSSGRLKPGSEAQNSYLTTLFDPKAYSEPKMTILGDPDFLVRDTPNSANEPYRQFYGDKFTINPNGGQVFIEIDFKEGVDYDIPEGTMTINESIQFWKYPIV